MASIVGAYYTKIWGIDGKTFIWAYDGLRPKVSTMSDEETTTETAEEASPAKEEPAATAAVSPENSRELAQKFGLVSGAGRAVGGKGLQGERCYDLLFDKIEYDLAGGFSVVVGRPYDIFPRQF